MEEYNVMSNKGSKYPRMMTIREIAPTVSSPNMPFGYLSKRENSLL